MNTLLNTTTFPSRRDPLVPPQSTSALPADLFLMLMDELAFGLVVLGANARVLLCNQAARDELDRCRVLGEREHHLYARTQDGSKQLRSALDEVQRGQRSLLHLVSEGAMVSLVASPPPAEYEATQATAILLFAKPAVCEPISLALFCRCHKLTKTEEHVLGILCLGYSTPEIATQMRVAVSTVRSHVRSLCAKTGTSGVRSLVNLVAVLPPVAAGQRLAPVH
jgi:DNA-binding CsgD family transcriptional regulator